MELREERHMTSSRAGRRLWRAHGLPLCASLVLLLSGVACQRHETTPVVESNAGGKDAWLTNYENALEQTRAEKKTLLIDFTGSDWCPPCMTLQRQVFAQPEFKSYAEQNLVLLEVDFPRTKELPSELQQANEQLANHFGIDGFPTVILLNSKGEKIGELGYMRGGPGPFVAAIEKIRAQSAPR